MRIKDFNKGQRLLIEEALEGRVPNRLREQMEAAFKGEINPLLDKDGKPSKVMLVDNTYDGLKDRIDEFDPATSRVVAFLIDKMGLFGGIYFECLSYFAAWPKDTARRRFGRFLRRFSPKDMKRGRKSAAGHSRP